MRVRFPPPAPNSFGAIIALLASGHSSVVEHLLPKQRVAGSNLVARSNSSEFGMGAGDFQIRLWHGEDSLDELTDLLHRAYARLKDMDLHFVATHQGTVKTQERIESGECWVAVRSGRLVGTITWYGPGIGDGDFYYDQVGIAHFGQFAVDPELQGSGLGRQLLEVVEGRARAKGATHLALDTSEDAHHLLELYDRWGFQFVQHTRWREVNYRSVVLTKALE